MQHTKDPDQNDFEELLAVLNDEELIRLRHRLNKKLNVRLVVILTAEIRKRERLWQQEKKHGSELS